MLERASVRNDPPGGNGAGAQRTHKLLIPMLAQRRRRLDLCQRVSDARIGRVYISVDWLAVYADSDGDGLLDEEEAALGTDPADGDTRTA